MFLVSSRAYFLINSDVGRGWKSVGKCGGRCGKDWGVREGERRCGKEWVEGSVLGCGGR